MALRTLFVSALVVAAASGPAHAIEARYKALPVTCKDSLTPEQKYRQANSYWGRLGGRGDAENMYICAAEAAVAGHPKAQDLFGRMQSLTRELAIGGFVSPDFKDLPDALYWFEKAGEGGNGQGPFDAGHMYELGAGVDQSDERAMALYRRAETLGYKQARPAISELAKRPERIAAFEAVHMAKAQAGDTAAMRAIAEAWLRGSPYAVNLKKGFEWMLKAAEAGDSDAMVRVARMYVAGVGTPQDHNAAADWLMLAWERGGPGIAFEITALYYNGKIDAAHKAKLEAFSKAYGKGSVAADLEPEAPPAPVPDRAALEAAAKSGDRDAVFNLAVDLLDGEGGSADPARARDLFLRLTDRVAAASMNLGDIYYTGKLGAPDKAEALKWYTQAAAMGDGVGAKNAALILRDGAPGVPADKVKAYGMMLMIKIDKDGVAGRFRNALTPEERAMAIAYAARVALSYHSYF